MTKRTRYASVIGLKEDKIEAYKKLHANCWPDVLKRIKSSNISNYSIHLRKMPDQKYYLFSYFEYLGSDFESDMQAIADDPITKDWWKECSPCQEPLEDRAEGEHWADMEEVFFFEG